MKKNCINVLEIIVELFTWEIVKENPEFTWNYIQNYVVTNFG